MNETLHKKSLASEYPLIASEWNVNRNQGLRPDSIAPHSNRSVWWVCPMGHEYEMVVNMFERVAPTGAWYISENENERTIITSFHYESWNTVFVFNEKGELVRID